MLGGSSRCSRETRHRGVATMATRTIVFVMLSLAASSRPMATVLNRLSSGSGIGEPGVHPVMPLGAAEGEPPMGEHSHRLGVITDTEHPMRRTKVRDSLQPGPTRSLCTHSRLGLWSGGRVYS